MSKHTPLEATARAATGKFLRAMSKDPMVRAADDMLEALRELVQRRSADGLPCWCDEDPEQYAHSPACQRARAAIAKAEGKAAP